MNVLIYPKTHMYVLIYPITQDLTIVGSHIKVWYRYMHMHAYSCVFVYPLVHIRM